MALGSIVWGSLRWLFSVISLWVWNISNVLRCGPFLWTWVFSMISFMGPNVRISSVRCLANYSTHFAHTQSTYRQQFYLPNHLSSTARPTQQKPRKSPLRTHPQNRTTSNRIKNSTEDLHLKTPDIRTTEFRPLPPPKLWSRFITPPCFALHILYSTFPRYPNLIHITPFVIF